ncbi:MAG: hypothetical protein ABR905_21070 [Terracidiphilus sp.]|jgi:hypothetical protein
MTVAEAEERIEALTRNLASSEISPAQRVKWEAQITRCYRIIQRARQQAHRSLASFAGTLLDMIGDTAFDQNQYSAIITAAYLIRGASIEQLAVAVPAAIRETPTGNTRPKRVKCPEFTEIVVCLLRLDSIPFSCERNIAIRTALHLSNIVGRLQIYQSVRRAQADTVGLGPKGMVNRLTEICSAYRPQKSGSSPRGSGSKKITSLSTPSTA